MHHKRTANQCKGPWSLHTALVALMMCSVLWPQASCEDIAIETLPPDYSRRPAFESANALLSEWEGDHWASLDADQDKVALSWTTTSDEAIFQVSTAFGFPPTSLKLTPASFMIIDFFLFLNCTEPALFEILRGGRITSRIASSTSEIWVDLLSWWS